MSPEKIKKLFIEFYDQTINLDGLVLFLNEVREGKHSNSYDFYFKMSNPNDFSYYIGVIEEELKDITDEFCNYLNVFGVSHIIGHKEELYFNKQLTNKIKNVFKKVTFIDFDLSFYEMLSKKQTDMLYKIEIEHVDIKTYGSYDTIIIDNIVKPISAFLNGKKCYLNKAINDYDEFLSDNERYYETEKYYIEIDTILNDYPLVSTEYMALYYNTRFI